jgi:hypothetical protein
MIHPVSAVKFTHGFGFFGFRGRDIENSMYTGKVTVL